MVVVCVGGWESRRWTGGAGGGRVLGEVLRVLAVEESGTRGRDVFGCREDGEVWCWASSSLLGRWCCSVDDVLGEG